MNKQDDQPVNGREEHRTFLVSNDEMNRIAAPLTVVHASLQLLRRRILRHPRSGDGDLDRALVSMEVAARTMVSELRSIMGR